MTLAEEIQQRIIDLENNKVWIESNWMQKEDMLRDNQRLMFKALLELLTHECRL